MTGGGSGGHITPILAVAERIKERVPGATIIYIGQSGDRFGAVAGEDSRIDEAHSVSAGKFRRYHGEGLRQLLDLKTIWLNIRDGFRVIKGLFQAYRLLGQIQPDVVFCKGGFVGVPVGLAAALRRIPYVTHDSDVIPGLANRIIARWAAAHAVAFDAKLYSYRQSITHNVGVPVANVYRPVTSDMVNQCRKKLKLSGYDQVILVTGGGLGAARVNHAFVSIARRLLDSYPRLAVIHTTGTHHEEVVREAYDAVLLPSDRDRVQVIGYTTKLWVYSAAADVVVARGGATNLAELAAQHKPSIIVPNPFLTGGHQLKNAEAYADKHAVVCLDESLLMKNHELLLQSLKKVLDDGKYRATIGENMGGFARPESASDLADLIIDIATPPAQGDEGV